MMRWNCLGLFVAIVMLAGSPILASGGESSTSAINAEDGLGVKGYDPVAYFTSGQPVPGVEQYSHRWNGVNYRFASAENLELFKANPEKYLPQYGGYCAYAMALNRIADADPNRWAIVDGKLYLNNNFFSERLWSLRKNKNIDAADSNWAALPKTSSEK